jgi:tumor protein p53-inducible protein 3
MAGAGATVILDCVGGSYVDQNIEAAATDARWVIYGLMGGARVCPEVCSFVLNNQHSSFLFTKAACRGGSQCVRLQAEGDVLRKMLNKRIQLLFTTLRTRSDSYKADLVSAFSEKILPGFEQGSFKFVVFGCV